MQLHSSSIEKFALFVICHFLDISVMEIKSAICLVRVAGLLIMYIYYASSWTDRFNMPSEQPRDASNVKSSQYPCVIDFKAKSADCKHRQLAEVPDYLAEDIVTLDLSENELKSLRNISFRRYIRIEVLDLSLNPITFIEEGTFFHLDRLRTLDLHCNEYLTTVNNSIFKWSSMLSTLDLSGCYLLAFPGDIFRWSPQLVDFYIDANSFPSFNITICPEKTISKLYFDYNNLQTITNETFVLNCSCDTLSLCYNPIHLVDPGVISRLPVRRLMIGGCREYTIDAFRNMFNGIAQSEIEEMTISGFCCSAVDTLDMLSDKHLKLVVVDSSEI